jgi:hypothetical protein
MLNLREEFLRGFLPESAFDFIFEYVGAMREERHGDISYQVIIPDDSEILFEEITCEIQKKN